MEYCEIPETVHEFASGTTDENIPDGNTGHAEAKSEELDIKPEITVPSDCLTAVSMPKNWSQVERLKQQRLILHRQLFSQKSNVKEEFKHLKTVKGHMESKSDKFELEKVADNLLTAQTQSLNSPNLYRNSPLFDDETDTCSSDDDDMPRLKIAESSTSSESDSLICTVSEGTVYSDNVLESNGMGQTENTCIKEPDLWPDNIKTESLCEEDENCSQKTLNSSDLCDLTASKINEALHNAIASVNIGKKQKNMRIKQVLEGLKMKAEEKESDNLEYRISKASATAARSSTSSTDQAGASDEHVKEINSESGLELQKDITNFAVLNPTRYVGLPTNVDNVLKKFDYKNIALQKYLAEKRLKEHGADIVTENEDSSTENQGNARLDEKPVELKMSCSTESTKSENDQDRQSKKDQLNRNISTQRRQLEVERELCQIKLELYQKQLQVGPKSHDLKETILLAKQKLIKAKEKMLEAEMKLNEHNRKIVENGIPLTIFPFLPYRFIGDSCNDGVTDFEDETCKIDIKSNPIETELPVCRKEPQMPVQKKGVKSSGELCSVKDEVNYIESRDISDQERKLETAVSQRKKENTLENKLALKISKSTLPVENIDLPVNGNSRKINVKSKAKKSVKRGKRTKTKCITESRKSKISSQISPVQTSVKTGGVLNSKDSALNGIARYSPVCKNRSQCQFALGEMMPQPNIQQNHTKSLQLVTSDGVQKPSLQCDHSGQNSPTEVILPSGFVKDEATNRTFHTYHFNGHTFVMIDNRLYQIHLKNTDGKTKSVIGTLIPTTASATSHLKNINTVSLQHSALASVTTTTCSAPLVQSFTSANAKATRTSHNHITYRFPVNMIPSASQARQPLNLLIITAAPDCAATQSTQALNKPLMNVVGGNNNVRAQLHRTFGRNTTSVVSSTCYQDANAVQLRVAPSHQNAFQQCSVGNFTTPAYSKTTPLTLTQPVTSQSVNQKTQYVNPTKCQQVNTTRSLSKNKTLVMMNTVPVNSASEVTTRNINEYKQHTDELTPSEEYCNSTKISTGLTASENQITNKATFILPKSGPSDMHVVDISQKVVSVDSDKLLEQNMNVYGLTVAKCNSEKLSIELPANTELENSKENISKKILNKEDSRQSSPAKICSSMDSFICTAKRKRKGTPVKKTSDKNIPLSLQSQKSMDNPLSPQSTPKEKGQDNLWCQKGEIEKKTAGNSEMMPDKVCGQVPFLDYPARIITSNKTGSSSKMKEIVPSPKDKCKHELNSYTSLNEEKMAKMISFANQLEAAKRKESVIEKSERKGALKKRHTDSGSPEGICKKRKDNDTEKSKEVRNISRGEDLKAENNPMKHLPLADEMKNKRKHAADDDIRSRNMFDKFSEIVYHQKSFLNESNKELNDSYDSSDMENYEKVVSDQKQKKAIMKPESQLIESYHADQGYGGMQRCQIEAQQSQHIAETCVTSESSLKNTDRLINPQKKLDFQKTNNNCLEVKQDTSKTKVDTISGSGQEADQNKSQVSQKALVAVGGRQVKKFIKTKFIILKGDICDRWFEIKKKTGFGEMSDPNFIHYLLRLEEERQAKTSQIQEIQIKEVNIDDTNGKLSTASKDVVQEKPYHGSHDVDMNNNNNAYSFTDETDSSSDIYDMEDTIVNVTDSPESSPRHPVPTDEKCEHCLAEKILPDKPVSEASCQEKQAKEYSENFADLKEKSDEKTSKKFPRKRYAAKMEDGDIPAAKKQMSVLSDATQRQMRWAVSLFREWLKEKGEEDLKFECKEPAWLDEKLAMFYEDALSHKETPYSTDILQTFRRSLSLYLSSDSLSKNVHISLAQDPEYAKSNSVLSCLILDETRWNISTVHERVVHTISEEDMEKIYTSKILSDEDPTHLLWKVWFDITYHLCKGRLPKNFWCSLSKHSLVLESDVNGVFYVFADYVYLPPDEEPGKMYATPDNPDKCPVRSTSLYLSKLSGNCNALFQCPKKSWNNYESWYWPVPLGREMLDSIISHISVHADLSKMYDVSSVIQTAKRKSSEKL